MLNDSSVLNKSVLLSKAALSRIIASVSHSYCLSPLTGFYLKRDWWNNTINLDPCVTSWFLEKSFTTAYSLTSFPHIFRRNTYSLVLWMIVSVHCSTSLVMSNISSFLLLFTSSLQQAIAPLHSNPAVPNPQATDCYRSVSRLVLGRES